MADTIPDIVAPVNDWVDIYTSTSITTGKALQITNKSPYPVLLHISSTKPSVSSTDGEPLAPEGIHSRLLIDSSETGVWAKSLDETVPATISVQEI